MSYDVTYVWNLNYDTETDPPPPDTESRLVVAKGDGFGGGEDWGVRVR